MAKNMVTAAVAKLLLVDFEEDKDYLLHMEQKCCSYTCGVNEEPFITDYNYHTFRKLITDIDQRIEKLKNALDLHFTVPKIKIDDEILSANSVQVRINHLLDTKARLHAMRKVIPNEKVYGMKQNLEYKHIAYDLEEVATDYARVCKEIIMLQFAYDMFLHTDLFEVED